MRIPGRWYPCAGTPGPVWPFRQPGPIIPCPIMVPGMSASVTSTTARAARALHTTRSVRK